MSAAGNNSTGSPGSSQGSPGNAASIKSAMSLANILSDPLEINVQSGKSASPAPGRVMVGNAHMLSSASDREVTPGELSNASDDSDSLGTTTDGDHDHANVHREFTCMNDEYSECRTGQYTLKLSRKVISNHFGRNKACTRVIEDWPLFCRKHYQRATYKPHLWQRRKVNLILRQFGVIERSHPGTTYNVSLKKSEDKRLSIFAKLDSSGISIAEAGAAVAPDPNIKSFQAPIDVLRELSYNGHLGPNKTKSDVENTLSVLNDMLRKGETKEVPSIEFLPELKTEKASKTLKAAKAPVTKKVKAPKNSVTNTYKIPKTPAAKTTKTKAAVTEAIDRMIENPSNPPTHRWVPAWRSATGKALSLPLAEYDATYGSENPPVPGSAAGRVSRKGGVQKIRK